MENNDSKNTKKGINSKLLLILVILLMTIGFAYLSANLGIFGTSKLLGSNYSIHWDDTSIVESGVTPTISAHVTDTDKKVIEFSTNLVLPGDYYEFTVDAVNDGDIDGAIKSIKQEIYNSEGEIITTPTNMIYTLTYSDDTTPTIGDVLTKKTGRKKYKVRVGFDSRATTTPTTDQTYTFKIEINYEQYSGE